ncbi:hypothetical protein DVR12_26640 [Chitinophaga silvatica]|uniref:Uncharacterized protein n=1 Tax=Chitinophaga silvatica TaxID=2282649 RepID=A0A3E1Y263_9BACT|nr:hypothetical protein [Chitinophaga silvatica]RFS18779.1 hypothetical protein DVR12_26640 [Chitinophaga silvatica]
MNITISTKMGACYGLLAHLIILIGGQFIALLVLFFYHIPFSAGIEMLKILETNVYAYIFFILLLAGGWIMGRVATKQIGEQRKGAFKVGLVSGFLIATATMVYWITIDLVMSGGATTKSMFREPTAVAYGVFILNWLLVAALIKKKIK